MPNNTTLDAKYVPSLPTNSEGQETSTQRTSKALRTSSFTDHAKTDMHHRAMTLLKRETATDVRSYAPIARSLYHMDKVTEETLKKKFGLAYFMAKAGIAFNKMKALSQLEERHGVALGDGYKNDLACATLTDYIGQGLCENLTETLHKAKFFSLQMDGSTDCANIEEELFLAVYFDPYSSHGTVQVKKCVLLY